jgi:hypothetical protein
MHVRSILSKSLVWIVILNLQLLFYVVFMRLIMKFVKHFNIPSNSWRYTRHETNALFRDVIEHQVEKKPEELITILIEYSHKKYLGTVKAKNKSIPATDRGGLCCCELSRIV